MTHDDEIRTFWHAYLESLGGGASLPDSYGVWHFGNSMEMANELGALVSNGVKTATCSLQWSYEVEGELLPAISEHSVITDWDGNPICIIETVEVEVKAFNEVDDRFAFEEGEGDRSLNYWREVHWRFFSEECASIGYQPTEDMPLVCERFRVVYTNG